MTEHPRDEFAKKFLSSLLQSRGIVRVGMEIPVDNSEIPLRSSLGADIPVSVYQYLGLLGKMISFPCSGLLVKAF